MKEKTKYCKRCDRDLPLSAFGTDRKRPDGLNFYCKECCRNYEREHRYDASYIYSQIKARVKFSKTNHNGYRSGAKRTMNISKKDFCNWYDSEPRTCHYCGLEEEKLHTDGDMYNDKINRLTVDCADNDKGYMKGNLVLCCGRCNSIKSDFLSYEEMLYVGKNMVSKRWK